MAIVKSLLAATPVELVEVSWRVHDAEFDRADVAFDPGAAEVLLEFEQEPRDIADGLPASALVRCTRRVNEYAVPFLRCRLLVSNALDVSDDLGEEASELSSVDFDQQTKAFRVWTNWGRLEIRVTALCVRLEITDEVLSVRRRRVGRAPRWDLTTRWRREQEDQMRALVLEPHEPPALHEVSAITRPSNRRDCRPSINLEAGPRRLTT